MDRKPRKTEKRILPSVILATAIVGIVAVGLWIGLRGRSEPATDDGLAAMDSALRSDRTGTMSPPEVAVKPTVNIVLFLIDTLRADRLGAYGYRAHETSPNIDRLAQRGVVFEDACAPAPWTIPSVASLFTSTFPCEHNMLGKFDRLASSADTLAERLKRVGYTSYSLIGNEFLGRKFGLAQGFDRLIGGGRNGGRRVNAALGPVPPKPFFVYIHNMEPHDPYHYAPAYTPGFRVVAPAVRERMKRHFKAYKAAAEHDYRRQLPLGTNDLTAAQNEHMAVLNEMREDWSELYDASVRYGDTHVGSLMSMLQSRGFWDNTLMILLADHGEEMNDHGSWLHDQSVYDELMRVPLIVRFPGDRFAGRRVKDSVSLVDVLPTIFDYLQVPDLAKGARGKSLMPLIREEVSAKSPSLRIPGMRVNVTRFYRPWVTTRGDTNIVIRQQQWKGIWNVDIDTFELYDLSEDPLEKVNIQAQHPQLVKAMTDYARTWREHCQEQAQETEEVGKLDDKTLRRLRALGYVD